MEKWKMIRIAKILAYLLLAVSMTFCVSKILVYGSEYVSKLIDQIAQGDNLFEYNEMSEILKDLCLIVILGFLSSFIKSFSSGLSALQITAWLKAAASEHITKIKESVLSGKDTGTLVNRLTGDIGIIERYLSESFFSLISAIITVFVVGKSIYMLDGKIMFQTMLLCILVLFISYITSKRLALLASGRRGRMDKLLGTADDFLNGIITGRSYNLYEIMEKKIDTVTNEVLQNEYKRTRISSYSWLLQTISQWLPTFAIIGILFWNAETMHISVGEVTYIVLMVNRLFKPFGNVPVLLNEAAEAYSSAKRVKQVFSFETEGIFEKEQIQVMNYECAVEFDNVSFSYGERAVLEHMNFCIKNNDIVAFVGTSGGGKTTIFNILCGFLEGFDGTYRLFGINSQAYTFSQLRECFSLVSQEAFLFKGTIYENILYGRQDSQMQDIIRVCQMACIHDDIMKMPNGYMTVIGENGTGLSGGEKQRISLARALLKDAPILLLDEPTSALDVHTETVISNTIASLKGKKTIIMIAHRLSTVSQSDMIFVLDKGNVAEMGNEAALISQKGIYYNLKREGKC